LWFPSAMMLELREAMDMSVLDVAGADKNSC